MRDLSCLGPQLNEAGVSFMYLTWLASEDLSSDDSATMDEMLSSMFSIDYLQSSGMNLRYHHRTYFEYAKTSSHIYGMYIVESARSISMISWIGTDDDSK